MKNIKMMENPNISRPNAPRDSNSIRSQVISIDPKLAENWLAKQVRNRKWRREVVNKYKAEMLAGKWAENGEPIIFEGEDQLVDGQHRLRAIIESGATIKSLVVFGVKPYAGVTIDTGISRTLGDIFTMRGLRNARLLSRTSKLLFVWETKFEEIKRKRTFDREIMNVHPEGIYQYYLRHQLDIDRVCGEFKKHSPLIASVSGAVLAFAYFSLEKINPDRCYVFMASLLTGNIKKEWSYMVQIRDFLLSRKPTSHTRLTETERISFLFGAWNVVFNKCSKEEVESTSLNIPSELLNL